MKRKLIMLLTMLALFLFAPKSNEVAFADMSEVTPAFIEKGWNDFFPSISDMKKVDRVDRIPGGQLRVTYHNDRGQIRTGAVLESALIGPDTVGEEMMNKEERLIKIFSSLGVVVVIGIFAGLIRIKLINDKFDREYEKSFGSPKDNYDSSMYDDFYE